MKPHIIMHMMTSIDGRIATTHWPRDFNIGDLYEQIHQEIGGDAWIVGPTTMEEFSEGEAVNVTARQTFPRETWKAPGAEQGPYAIAVDRNGRLHLNIGHANGDPIITVLTNQIDDDHLAELRRDGISYIFTGETEIDLQLALNILRRDFSIKRLLLEGGGGINGAFLEHDLINEISLLVLPFADGERGAPTLFDRSAGKAKKLQLSHVSRLDHDVLHLRYQVT